MKRFEIFRPGRHTASSGATLDFSEDALRAAVSAYDPGLHEAPIVVGHPKDNGPAYGWVSALHFNEETGAIEVDPDQVDPAFAELVQAGRYKKRSASWYLPDSKANPKPGTLYLRHVGFLGAQPPAIKGLKEVNFSEDDGVVEFSDPHRWAFGSIAAALRGLREWLIEKDGTEAADKAMPNYLLGDVDRAANEQDPAPVAAPTFTEEDPMKIEQLQAQVAQLTADLAAAQANAKPADFAEREADLKAREDALAAERATIDRATVQARVDGAVNAGRVLPAKAKAVVDFAMGLATGEASIDFGEGDQAEKITQREAYLRQIEASPKVVEFGELAADNGSKADGKADPVAIADKARDLVAKANADGKTLSFTEAVAQATTELSA